MGDEKPRAEMVKRMRTFATELRMRYQGRTADHVAKGIEELADAVEHRRPVTLLVTATPTDPPRDAPKEEM